MLEVMYNDEMENMYIYIKTKMEVHSQKVQGMSMQM
jgi:hypothetical protein